MADGSFLRRATRDFAAAPLARMAVAVALVERRIALGRCTEALAEAEACWRRSDRGAACVDRDRDVLEGVARELRRDAAIERLRPESGEVHDRR